MNSQPLSPVEQKVHRIAVDSQTNRWINRPGTRRMRARRWEGNVDWRWKADPCPVLGGQRRRRSKSEGEASCSQARSAGGADDRKEEMMEQMEEQRAFYMWAERRGGANPDLAGLNRKRQRTGTETTG
jgi:hypothetical protein